MKKSFTTLPPIRQGADIICRFNRKSENEVFAIAVDEKLLPFIEVQLGFSIFKASLASVKKSFLGGSTHLVQLVHLGIPFSCQCATDEKTIEAGKSHFDCSGFFPVPMIVGACRV